MIKQMRIIAVFFLFIAGFQGNAQMLLGKFDCNGNSSGEGNLLANNYLDAQINLSDLLLAGSNVSLEFTNTSVKLVPSGLVGPANCIYFSIAPKEGYIVEIRRIVMNIKKDTKSGNVIMYVNTAGQPFSNANSTSIYNAGNSNTDTTFNVVQIAYPAAFSEPIKISNPAQPANILLSSGSNGGALSIDDITIYGYVYKESDPPPAEGIEKTFGFNLNDKAGVVSPLFWGTNFLFWLENDSALADGKIEESLKNLPVSVLRYPGGTVADNFHWKTNLLSNNNRFPYDEGEEQTDFDEFMAFCQRVGAEPILVVNTEAWKIAQDIDGGVQEAVDWVQYCKDKGYKVKYWEIGNETYWHPFFTAREYGQTVKKYAQAMKAVDPSIKISANGHWSVDFVGTKERTDPAEWENIRIMHQNIASKEDFAAAKAYAEEHENPNRMEGDEKWWKIVADECGEYIDMISIHWYFSGNTNMGSMTANLNQVRELFKTKFPDREYIMCMTEYNCNHDDHRLAISGFFDGIGRFLMAGVEIGNQWPLRNGSHGGKTSMLYPWTKEEQYTYQILQLYAQNLKGDLLDVTSENLIFPLATYDQEQLTVVVSGRGITSQPVIATMDFPEMEHFSLVDARTFDAPATNNIPIQLVQNELQVTVSETACTFKVMPYQTVMLRFRNNDYTAVDQIHIRDDVHVFAEKSTIHVTHENEMHVTIYNLQGIPVRQTNGRGKITFDMQDGGIYLVRVVLPGNNIQLKKVYVKR